MCRGRKQSSTDSNDNGRIGDKSRKNNDLNNRRNKCVDRLRLDIDHDRQRTNYVGVMGEMTYCLDMSKIWTSKCFKLVIGNTRKEIIWGEYDYILVSAET